VSINLKKEQEGDIQVAATWQVQRSQGTALLFLETGERQYGGGVSVTSREGKIVC